MSRFINVPGTFCSHFSSLFFFILHNIIHLREKQLVFIILQSRQEASKVGRNCFIQAFRTLVPALVIAFLHTTMGAFHLHRKIIPTALASLITCLPNIQFYICVYSFITYVSVILSFKIKVMPFKLFEKPSHLPFQAAS